MVVLFEDQAVLFEPFGSQIAPLVLEHLQKAARFRRASEVLFVRGWETLAGQHVKRAAEHEAEAECLAALADFERLGGVYA